MCVWNENYMVSVTLALLVQQPRLHICMIWYALIRFPNHMHPRIFVKSPPLSERTKECQTFGMLQLLQRILQRKQAHKLLADTHLKWFSVKKRREERTVMHLPQSERTKPRRNESERKRCALQKLLQQNHTALDYYFIRGCIVCLTAIVCTCQMLLDNGYKTYAQQQYAKHNIPNTLRFCLDTRYIEKKTVDLLFFRYMVSIKCYGSNTHFISIIWHFDQFLFEYTNIVDHKLLLTKIVLCETFYGFFY